MMRRSMRRQLHYEPGTFIPLLCLVALLLIPRPAPAQDNYEIQVYGADTVAPGSTMLELHSNFTVDGSKTVIDGVQPPTTPSTRPSRSRRESTTGSRPASTFSPASSPMADGTGSAIIFA